MKLNEHSFISNIVSDCKRALELEGQNVKALFYLGQAYLLLSTENNINRALVTLKSAYELSFQSGSLSFEISQMYLKAKQAHWKLKDSKRRAENDTLYSYIKKMIEDHEVDQIEKVTRLEQVEGLFQNCTLEREKRYDPPDSFIGKINFEIMVDPVITPSGVTFDRIEIMEHLSKIGKFDPFTRQALDVNDLIPNLALKETIDEFLEKNGWAVDY